MSTRSKIAMVVMQFLVAAALHSTAEAGAWGCNRNAAGNKVAAGALRIESGQARFTVFNNATNVTEPKFLSVLSYFGAMRPGHDPAPAFALLCDYQINAVRIFVDFWLTGSYCSGGHLPNSDAVIKTDGTLNTTRVNQLKAVLSAARAAGLVVDLSFGFETVLGRTIAKQAEGIARLAHELNSPAYDHVMFDVQNEFEANGCPKVDNSSYVPALIHAGRYGQYGPINLGGDATRVVTASTAEDNGGRSQLYTRLSNMVAYTGANALAPHDSRQGAWWSTDLWLRLAELQVAGGIRRPVYAQEPERWYSGSGITEWHLYLSARNAKITGAAAWTFHTEALFFPGAGSSWNPVELRFLGYSPSSYTLFDALIDDCWGLQAPAGFFPSCLV